MISHEELCAMFRYCPETGEFTRLVDRGRCGRAGSIAGTLNHHGYVQICINWKKYQAHRLAWFYQTGEWPKNQIDHIDRNRANNKWENLRPATSKQNHENQGASGVYWHERDKRWKAHIGHHGKHIHLGYYLTEDEARAARKRAERELFTHAT